jgi:phospholipid/cholesterol/gamma-HCH transport system ATP-binding protein
MGLFSFKLADKRIELSGACKAFGGKEVLKGIDLSVSRGKRVIIGGSGSGKSVILKHIIGIMKPDRGDVSIDGADIACLRGYELYETIKTAMPFQLAALFDSMCVWESVDFTVRGHKCMQPQEVKVIAIEKLKMVGLAGIEDQMPSDLSWHMRGRPEVLERRMAASLRSGPKGGGTTG